MSSLWKFFSHPFPILWRTALVRLPRAVPLFVLKWTSPEGPQPFIFQLASRDPTNYSIPLYIFIPPSLYTKQVPVPVLIDFHGGGFYLGSCMEQAPFCSQLAREMDCVVISVDYRMAPLNTFPAAIEDGEDVLSAILEEGANGYNELRECMTMRIEKGRKEYDKCQAKDRKKEEHKRIKRGEIEQVTPTCNPFRQTASFEFDKSKVAVSGFSSGGNLALNLALHIRPPELQEEWPSVFSFERKAPIPLLLFYPSFDLRQLPSERTRPPSLADGSPFWAQISDLLAPTYVPRDQTHHPRVSPGLASISCLHASAKIFLVLAELDTLSEQSKIWVEKVNDCQRVEDVVVQQVNGVKHGWTQIPEGWLDQEERRLKNECFEKAREFVKWAWEGRGKSLTVPPLAG